MTLAIKEIGKQVYVAKEQFGIKGSLMISREGGQVQYHPMQFQTLTAARAYLKDVVNKTHSGRKRKWEIVSYM